MNYKKHNMNNKWIRKGDSYWLSDYLRVKFYKVSSFLYADVYLPKISTEDASEGLFFRYNSPIIAIKKTLEYISSLNTKYKLGDLTISDVHTKTVMQIHKSLLNSKHELRYDTWRD